MKLTYKQKQGIASKIPSRYDYMNRLPMKGWAWEFLRRNKQYIEAFSRLEEKIKENVKNDDCGKILTEIGRIANPYGLLIGRTSFKLGEADRGNLLTLELPPYQGDKAVLNKYFGNHESHIPKPDRRYCDFAIPSLFMSRWEMRDYIIYKSFNSLLYTQTTVEQSPDNKISVTAPYIDRNEDFFYIAVSKCANMVDIKEKMLNDIAKILKKNKPRVRQRKWKYYLIVYDLKQESNDKMSFDEIAEILIKAYHGDEAKLFTETRNIINWYGKATSLINGNFLKHLKFER
jgi:hypothetical protein